MRRKTQNGNKSSAATTWAPKQGRPTQAIIENNRKTELCRNWQKGACTYGGRCAFAHGVKELKYRTLREMENAGRIPDASKYRCYPCMTWVATGSCPYASRCVFIHDLRVKGPVEAWLYAGCLSKSPTACPSNDSFFFFPDIARDPDSTELPTHPAQYDLEPRTQGTGETSSSAVYNLWYSFVSTLIEAEDTASPASTSTSTVTATAKTPTSGPASTPEDTAAKKRSKNYAAAAAAAAAAPASEGTTAGGRQTSKLSQASGKLKVTAVPPISSVHTAHPSGFTTTNTTTTSNSTSAANANSSATTSAFAADPQQSSRQRRLLRENRRPRGSVRHLPIFEALSKGIPTRPTMLLSPPNDLAGDGPSSIPLVKESGSSFWDDSGSEGLLSFGSYPSSCAESSHSVDTEEISTPPTPRMATGPSTDSESYISPPSEGRCHIYSCEHLRLLQPGRLPPTSAFSFHRVDSWKSDSAGNPSDISDQPVADDVIKVQESGGASIVLKHPTTASDSVAGASVRSGYAVVHHRQQACAGTDPIGGTVDAALRKTCSIHAVPSF